MSTYNINSSTLKRLASICNFFESTTSEELKNKINTVRLENRNGYSFAVSTNQKIASIEFLGATDKPNGSTHLKISEDILNYPIDENITVMTVPEIALSTLQFASGKVIMDCSYWLDDTPLNNWREWIGKPLSKSNVMCWNLFHIESLIKASPSERIYFPADINPTEALILRDVNSPNWVGLFVPSDETVKHFAELPEWWDL